MEERQCIKRIRNLARTSVTHHTEKWNTDKSHYTDLLSICLFLYWSLQEQLQDPLVHCELQVITI